MDKQAILIEEQKRKIENLEVEKEEKSRKKKDINRKLREKYDTIKGLESEKFKKDNLINHLQVENTNLQHLISMRDESIKGLEKYNKHLKKKKYQLKNMLEERPPAGNRGEMDSSLIDEENVSDTYPDVKLLEENKPIHEPALHNVKIKNENPFRVQRIKMEK